MSKISRGAVALTVAVVASAAVSPLASQPSTAAAVPSSDWSKVLPILQRSTSVLNSPPTQTPGVNVTSDNRNIPDGSFMGDGDVTVTVGGTAASQTYTVTTTDSWNGTQRAVVGPMTVNTPGFDLSASYRQEQDPGLAEMQSTFTEGTQGLKIRSLTAATANTMIVQLTISDSMAINGMTLVTKAGSVGTNFALPLTDGVDASHGTAWVTRTTDGPWVARDALVTRVVDGTSSVAVTSSSAVTTTLSLAAGATVQVLAAVGGDQDSTSHLTDAQNNASGQIGAFHRLPRHSCRHRGGIDQAQQVMPGRGVLGEFGDHRRDQGSSGADPFVVAGLAWQSWKNARQMGACVADPTGFRVELEQMLSDHEAEQLCIREHGLDPLTDAAEFAEAFLLVTAVGADQVGTEFVRDKVLDLFACEAFVADDDLAGAE